MVKLEGRGYSGVPSTIDNDYKYIFANDQVQRKFAITGYLGKTDVSTNKKLMFAFYNVLNTPI